MARVELQNSASSIHSAKPMSRLEQMQADLQRKMLQEKEEKMVKLYNDNQSRAIEKVNSGGSNGRIGGGNVRKFFQERRALGESINLDSSLTSLDSYFLNASNGLMASQHGLMRPKKSSPVGWDKSYPLVPIERTNSGSSSGYESIGGQHKQYSTSGEPRKRTPHPRRQSLDRNRTSTSTDTSATLMRRSKSQVIDGSRTTHEPTSGKSSTTTSPTRGRPPPFRENRLRDEEKRKMQLEMRRREQELVNKIKEQQAEIERMRQDKLKEEKAQKARLMRKPMPPNVRPPPTRVQRQESERSSPVSKSDEIDSSTSPSVLSTPAKPAGLPKKPSPVRTKPPAMTPKEKPPPPRRVSSSNSDLPECSICGRRFAPDRIEKHISVCKTTTTKKRKIFDPVKMRTQGTEQESFIKKGAHKKEPSKPKKSDWRKKHENFLQAIRQARQMSDHVAAGGKLSDLPPPPPLDTSDYVQCPHCGRKFSEGAAERHIPKCQSIRSNKK